MSLTFVQGDTAPVITSTIKYDDGTPVDLTGCSVRFQMREADDKLYTVDSDATITDHVNGKVSYSWGQDDLSRPGDYIIQWQVTYQSGAIQTTAEPESVVVRRQ